MARLVIYQSSIVSLILDFMYVLNGYGFSFDHMTGENTVINTCNCYIVNKLFGIVLDDLFLIVACNFVCKAPSILPRFTLEILKHHNHRSFWIILCLRKLWVESHVIIVVSVFDKLRVFSPH